jgi:hypothetical protein
MERRNVKKPNPALKLAPLLTEEQAAPLLGTTPQHLRNCRCTGRGAYAELEYFKLGRSVRLSPHDIARFLERRRRGGNVA